ncbi:hypothetical protein QBC47DRAFT_139344 [Echria macrotheca]|uniref:Uncharacterized protein n=1 Tax=Echria macrotheca TaxID=438768 RepID=A0AAJ0BI41_9PEZI|nr:hypothetical protein QBC47DRAFT_139344 [Echria macrotheca]
MIPTLAVLQALALGSPLHIFHHHALPFYSISSGIEPVAENARASAATVSFAALDAEVGNIAHSTSQNPPERQSVPNARRMAAKRKEKQTPGDWLRRMITWWSISEPSARALERHRIAQFRKVGLAADAPSEEATYRLHAPIGKIPDDAVKPSSGPTPEQAYRRKHQRKQQQQRKESISTESQHSASSSTRTTRPKVDPRKLAVAPWLAEEGPASSHGHGNGNGNGQQAGPGCGRLIAPWLAEGDGTAATASSSHRRAGARRSLGTTPTHESPWLAEA